MKHFKRFLCVVLTLLLVVPGGLAEDMAQALTTGTEEISTAFEDAVDHNDGVAADEDATADEDVAISAPSIDPDVAEAGEMDLSSDDGDVETKSGQQRGRGRNH